MYAHLLACLSERDAIQSAFPLAFTLKQSKPSPQEPSSLTQAANQKNLLLDPRSRNSSTTLTLPSCSPCSAASLSTPSSAISSLAPLHISLSESGKVVSVWETDAEVEQAQVIHDSALDLRDGGLATRVHSHNAAMAHHVSFLDGQLAALEQEMRHDVWNTIQVAEAAEGLETDEPSSSSASWSGSVKPYVVAKDELLLSTKQRVLRLRELEHKMFRRYTLQAERYLAAYANLTNLRALLRNASHDCQLVVACMLLIRRFLKNRFRGKLGKGSRRAPLRDPRGESGEEEDLMIGFEDDSSGGSVCDSLIDQVDDIRVARILRTPISLANLELQSNSVDPTRRQPDIPTVERDGSKSIAGMSHYSKTGNKDSLPVRNYDRNVYDCATLRDIDQASSTQLRHVKKSSPAVQMYRMSSSLSVDELRRHATCESTTQTVSPSRHPKLNCNGRFQDKLVCLSNTNTEDNTANLTVPTRPVASVEVNINSTTSHGTVENDVDGCSVCSDAREAPTEVVMIDDEIPSVGTEHPDYTDDTTVLNAASQVPRLPTPRENIYVNRSHNHNALSSGRTQFSPTRGALTRDPEQICGKPSLANSGNSSVQDTPPETAERRTVVFVRTAPSLRGVRLLHRYNRLKLAKKDRFNSCKKYSNDGNRSKPIQQTMRSCPSTESKEERDAPCGPQSGLAEKGRGVPHVAPPALDSAPVTPKLSSAPSPSPSQHSSYLSPRTSAALSNNCPLSFNPKSKIPLPSSTPDSQFPPSAYCARNTSTPTTTRYCNSVRPPVATPNCIASTPLVKTCVVSPAGGPSGVQWRDGSPAHNFFLQMTPAFVPGPIHPTPLPNPYIANAAFPSLVGQQSMSVCRPPHQLQQQPLGKVVTQQGSRTPGAATAFCGPTPQSLAFATPPPNLARSPIADPYSPLHQFHSTTASTTPTHVYHYRTATPQRQHVVCPPPMVLSSRGPVTPVAFQLPANSPSIRASTSSIQKTYPTIPQIRPHTSGLQNSRFATQSGLRYTHTPPVSSPVPTNSLHQMNSVYPKLRLPPYSRQPCTPFATGPQPSQFVSCYPNNPAPHDAFFKDNIGPYLSSPGTSTGGHLMQHHQVLSGVGSARRNRSSVTPSPAAVRSNRRRASVAPVEVP
eukprot:GHVQ01040747.1.p1 GENE.GHVQ01040747.1~~GHVQ01040747.1.p1  ORF type:complete len:1130 (-),score=167.64 GHVQ01040747.1:3733-7122(-)